MGSEVDFHSQKEFAETSIEPDDKIFKRWKNNSLLETEKLFIDHTKV